MRVNGTSGKDIADGTDGLDDKPGHDEVDDSLYFTFIGAGATSIYWFDMIAIVYIYIYIYIIYIYIYISVFLPVSVPTYL